MALATTLYIQHGKAKAKATEVAAALAAVIGRTIPIEYEWKFVDQAAFKTIPTDTQKSILVNTLGHNLTQCLVGAQDSLAAALAASAPLRDIIAPIAKIVFSYDYANTIASAVGAAHLNVFIEGTSLYFKSNLNAVQLLNNGDWGVMSKLLTLASGSVATSQVAAPAIQAVPIVTAPVAMPATSQVVISPPVAAASPSAQVVASAKRARVGGSPGGNGASTFLYMTIDKVKKRATEIGKELSNRLGTTITFEVDLNSLVKDSTFTKESEADQKAFLTAAPDTWAGALYAAVNGCSTIEVALRAQPGLNKVKWVYAPSNQPTPGWGFLEVSGSGSELLVKCAISSVDETYGVLVANATAAAPAAATVPVQQTFVPLPAAVPVVAQAPVVAQPVAVPVMIQPVAMPVAAPQPVASPVAAAPSGPVPGTRIPSVGGKPGGNGATGFLYTPLEKLKKFVADTYTKEFTKSLSSARTSLALDVTFVKNASFMQRSEADQRACVTGPMIEQITSIAYKATNGDHLVALFKNPEYLERCMKITKVTFVYASDVTSGEGYNGWALEWCDNGTEIQIRIDIESVDMIPDDSWGVAKKAHEGLFGVEKRKEEAARVLAEREAMAALEKKAAANLAEEEKRMLEQKAAAAKLAEQERLRKELEAGIAERIALLEESGVTPRMKENNERLKKFLGMVAVSGNIEYDVDNLFIHDKKLRWRDCGTQKTTLKSISIETWSLFNVLTDAAISILESGDVGQKRLLDTYSKFNLQFEQNEPTVKVPRLVLDPSTKTLNVFATFSNMYDPRKWIDELLNGVPAKQIYKGTNITEIFKAMLASAGGWLEDMARDEATTSINDILAPYFKEHFEGRIVPIEVDWKSLDGQNSKQALIVRMKKHYQFPPCVLEQLFKSFKLSNLIVMKVLRAKLQKIRVVASGSDSIVIEDGGALMTVNYKWADQAFTPAQWKAAVEEQVREKCQGLAVKNVSAEIAMHEGSTYILEMNRILCAKLGMLSADGGYDVLVVDYPNFVDTLEFNKQYGSSKFSVLHTSNIGALNSLVAGFEEVAGTKLGGPLLKTVKRILVKLDVKSKDNTYDAPLHWDPATKTFTITHSFHSFEHPSKYHYTPRIEYTMDILIESCRLETKTKVEQFYSTVRSDFCLSSLPVLIDESYQDTPEFKKIHPSEMKAIIMRFFTTVPPSIFHGPMGLKHCSEFPKARQIMHDKVKKIRILPDGLLASNTSKVELRNDELLVRLAYDSKDWNTPIGYHLSQIIGSRPTIESEVIAEIDTALIGYTDLLRKSSKNSKIAVKFNWAELLKDATFQAAQNYVNDYVRYMLTRVKRTFDGSGKPKAIYDAGLLHYLASEGLADHVSDLDTIEYHVLTSNSVLTQGQFGLFTPYKYRITKEGKTLHVYFNFDDYPVGIGSMVEWVCNPAGAKKREQSWITLISERNYKEEMEWRDQEVANTIASNKAAQRRYESDVDAYNRQVAENASTPNTEKCSSCQGKGYWGKGNRCSSCSGRGWKEVRKTAPVMPAVPQPQPIPTFPHVTVADFTHGLDRPQLRHGHYIEKKNRFHGE